MGFRFLILFISFLLSSYLYGQQEGNLILQSEISIRLTDQPVSTVLDSISRQIGYYFSYDPVLVQANRKINVSFSKVSLEKILNAIFKQQFVYKILKDQIIITKGSNFSGNEGALRNPEDDFLLLSGKVIDLDNNSPIPYASVSIWNRPVGTISNSDGEFDLKILDEQKDDTLIFSCVGYQKYFLPVRDFEFEKNSIYLRPVSIRIKEIKVKAIEAREIVRKMFLKIAVNYPDESFLMTSFYRETLRQDDKYMNVSEAVMDILKTSYVNDSRGDRTRFVKGRKNNQELLFKWVDFKIQGGPYYITLLDIVKTRETFLEPKFLNQYKYEIDEVIFYRDRPTYIITFKPVMKSDDSAYQGKLYIDRETLALVQANFELSKSGLKSARKLMIKKKPRGFKVRPEEVSYQVTYKLDHGKWFFNTARAHILFKVRSRNDKINSIYTSTSDLLITDYTKTDLKRFKRSETFHPGDIFTEIITDFDEKFWGQYNIIKPDEDLRKAIQPRPDKLRSEVQ